MTAPLITIGQELCGTYIFYIHLGTPHVERCTKKAGHEGEHGQGEYEE